jgi:hypothetical protein
MAVPVVVPGGKVHGANMATTSWAIVTFGDMG